MGSGLFARFVSGQARLLARPTPRKRSATEPLCGSGNAARSTGSPLVMAGDLGWAGGGRSEQVRPGPWAPDKMGIDRPAKEARTPGLEARAGQHEGTGPRAAEGSPRGDAGDAGHSSGP